MHSMNGWLRGVGSHFRRLAHLLVQLRQVQMTVSRLWELVLRSRSSPLSGREP